MSRIRTIVAATLAIGAGGVVAGGTGSAAAAEVFHVDNGRTTVVYLTHAETVTAAHVGVGNAINMLMGNDRWAVNKTLDTPSPGITAPTRIGCRTTSPASKSSPKPPPTPTAASRWELPQESPRTRCGCSRSGEYRAPGPRSAVLALHRRTDQ